MTQHFQTRDRILESATQLMIEDGIQMSMASLASRAGVAVGTLYNHFESKEVLVRAIYSRLSDTFYGALTRQADPTQNARQKLDSYILRYIDFFDAEPQQAVLFEYLSSMPVVPAAVMAEAFAGPTTHIQDILTQLEAEGALIDAEIGTLGAFIGGAIRNTLKWRRVYNKPLADSDRQTIADMCKRAILVGYGG
ncbi:MAG: TetR/AcrR family transcriptional regulator [Rhodobacter sp.]|nr:TetR/AcrR family transcriptional regulator [Paracoccaceae bacterium]MCC0077110.1 TetR/AcrR family transcriptional regulator [Rhodobacter sp.]